MAGILDYLAQGAEEAPKKKKPHIRIKSSRVPSVPLDQVKPKGSARWTPPKSVPNPSAPTATPHATAEAAARTAPQKAPGILARAANTPVGKVASKVARVAGSAPVVGAQLLMHSEKLGDADMRKAGEGFEPGTQAAASAANYRDQLVSGLMKSINDQYRQQAPDAPELPQEVVEEEANEQQQVIEQHRQVIQQGAQKGLSSGEVSRPSLAEAVVQADAERAGNTLSPEQTKAAVQEELTAMKSMDNNDLSKYISYALIAGGVLASFMDKSGQAGDIFHDSFNKGLDRQEAAKAQAAAAAQAERKAALEERKVDITGADVESKIENRLATQGLSGERLGLDRERLGLDRELGYGKLGQGAAGISLRGQELASLDAYRNRRLTLAEQKEAREASQKGSGATGVPLSMADNEAAVKAYTEGTGQKMDSKLRTVVAGELATARKLYPETPTRILVQAILDGYGDELTTGKTGVASIIPGWGTDTIQFKKD